MGTAAQLHDIIPQAPRMQELKEELINKPTKKVKRIYEDRGNGFRNIIQRLFEVLGF